MRERVTGSRVGSEDVLIPLLQHDAEAAGLTFSEGVCQLFNLALAGVFVVVAT